ncbi:hypothetical protein WA556_001182, partial [Blastocystis sp. ATCC 50177/Nand II]
MSRLAPYLLGYLRTQTCFAVRRSFGTVAPISITAKTIREDGDVQYIDVDADPSKTLLDTLKEKTKIQYHCGGKGVCGQCVIGLPKDVYMRLPRPSDDEMTAIQVNLEPPQYGRLACQLK